MITRFAPSPTGFMHVGNARTALICWLYARNKAGKFLLRIDDTDKNRSEERYVDAIKKDLEWLSIDWDLCFNQCSRIERYDSVFNSLVSEGVIYPCYETQEELNVKRSMMLKMGLPPIYDRSALRMTEKERNTYHGRQPYFRLKIDQSREISWQDEIRGTVTFKAKNISDPIIKRTDGTYTYMFPSVVDDMDFSVTHVIRGEDHVSNTATQICIIDMLKANVPAFAHLPLVRIGDSKISKRSGDGDIEIGKLRDMGVEPMAINSYFARLGTSLAIEPCGDMNQLVGSFDVNAFNQAPVQFSLEDIFRFSGKILQDLPFSSVRDRLSLRGIKCSEEFWHLIRNNINALDDVKVWTEVCYSEITPVIDENSREFLSLAKTLLPEGELDHDACSNWLAKIREKTGRNMKEILLPLRLAITGLPHGPGFAGLCLCIGRKKIIRRLEYTK